MASGSPSLSDFISSFFDLVSDFFGAIGPFFITVSDLVYKTISMMVAAFIDIIEGLSPKFFSAITAPANGIMAFLTDNIHVISVIVAAILGFLQYKKYQGTTVMVGEKKRI
ncbi:hypothetical protein K432DRAFT_443687 [Lepidopterella palustris CBS 459.81]|uniref:Uncharacterized protein n=1 Tax=Lepidopterella palustris CBS 459.81 TaxID=1314670 RepID=A0A8E2E954_9PEZI|nr:hypothetical protein K432DRAFT_443687 [Lepidopterella palustris CBS 459.81]